MVFNSPLRYPGGKNRLAKFIADVCCLNRLTGHYVEPYAGGAAVALHLLFNDYVKTVTINDKDRAVYAFWHSILNHPQEFCQRIERCIVNVRTWKRHKIIQNDQDASLFDLGFSTFFLNRTNRSGILSGGILGGMKQDGIYKINCRFNKTDLIERIQKIASLNSRIQVFNLDAEALIRKIQKKKGCMNTLYYLDPPYFQKGPLLYMNYYDADDHRALADRIKKIKDSRWIVSYDSVPTIKKYYRGYGKMEYLLTHTAYGNSLGSEVLFFSNNLLIPEIVPPMKALP